MKILWLGAAAATALLAASPALAQVTSAPIVKVHPAAPKPKPKAKAPAAKPAAAPTPAPASRRST